MAMVEPFLSVRHGGRVRNLLDPDSTIRSIHIAAGLGASQRPHLAEAAGRRRAGPGHGRHHPADPAARRRPAGRPARHVRRRGARRSTCRPCAAWSSAGPCSTRRTATSPRRSTSPPSWCTGPAPMSGSGRWVLPLGQRGARRLGRRRRRHASTGWQHTGLRVAALAAGEQRGPSTAGAGSTSSCRCPVRVESRAPTRPATTHEAVLAGRPSVFAGPTDVAYVPAGSRLDSPARRRGRRVASAPRGSPAGRGRAPAFRHLRRRRGPGRAARRRQRLPRGPQLRRPRRARRRLDHRLRGRHPGRQLELLPAAQARRGARRASRPSSRRSTTSRSRSSADAPTPGADPVGYQRVYGTAERPIDVLAEVRTGDVVLVPHGWHGPAMAAPGYDLYYLNVMAGPGPERAWLICDDPAHGWVRDTWARPGRRPPTAR